LPSLDKGLQFALNSAQSPELFVKLYSRVQQRTVRDVGVK
jgi:hypothetical protein